MLRFGDDSGSCRTTTAPINTQTSRIFPQPDPPAHTHTHARTRTRKHTQRLLTCTQSPQQQRAAQPGQPHVLCSTWRRRQPASCCPPGPPPTFTDRSNRSGTLRRTATRSQAPGVRRAVLAVQCVSVRVIIQPAASASRSSKTQQLRVEVLSGSEPCRAAEAAAQPGQGHSLSSSALRPPCSSLRRLVLSPLSALGCRGGAGGRC